LLLKTGARGCFAVKENQKKLLRACQQRTCYPATSRWRSVNKEHGLVIERETKVFPIPKRERSRFWNSFYCVVQTTRSRSDGYREQVLHLLTHEATAEQAAQLVRGHWSIENRLHWVRDFIFREDQHRSQPSLGLLLTKGMNTVSCRGLKWSKAMAEVFQWDVQALAACAL